MGSPVDVRDTPGRLNGDRGDGRGEPGLPVPVGGAIRRSDLQRQYRDENVWPYVVAAWLVLGVQIVFLRPSSTLFDFIPPRLTAD